MKTRKNGLPDRRFRINRTLQAREHAFWQRYGTLICSIILGLLAGIILGKSLWDATNTQKTPPQPLGRTIESKRIFVSLTSYTKNKDIHSGLGLPTTKD